LSGAAETRRGPGREPGLREGSRDMIAATLLLVLTCVFWWDSTAISAAEARMFPRLVLLALAALGLLLFLRGLRAGPEAAETPVISALPAFAAFLGATAVYGVAVGWIGFFTASLVYIPVVARLIGLRALWLNALVTAVFLLVTWLVFVGLFARPLPAELFWT
jgi:hypothetical protein